MKKILIATSAIAAVSATSAFALDVKTSGTVEYKYTKNKMGNTAQNAKLSQGYASVKFAASGASNGLAYGAFVTFKSNAGADRKVYSAASDTVIGKTTGTPTAHKFLGWDENGVAVAAMSKDGAAAVAAIVKDTSKPESTTSAKVANNATTQSAIWVSGAFGKVVAGQSGSAAGDNAVSGKVSAATFEKGTQVAEAGYDQKSAERLTYTAPTFIDGLTVAYTHSFKGNTSQSKTLPNSETGNKAKAPSNFGIQYATNLMGVGVKVAHVVGKTGLENGTEQTKTIGGTVTGTVAGITNSHYDLETTVKYTEKQRTNTGTGIELAYGNFTVGYGVFNNEKKHYQTKDTSGSNYGVKYSGGAWAVGYTVMKSEDKNKYYGAKTTKSASTNAISASYQIADGFSAYASKSSNKVKGTDGKTTKNNYTIIGAKISF